MAAGAQRQYRADFVIGAKLLGSFRGAMGAAQARMAKLRASMIGLGKTFATSFLGGAFGALAASSVLRNLFSGAAEDAAKMEETTRGIAFALLNNNKIRKAGLPLAEKQRDIIVAQSNALSKQGVLDDDLYNSMAKRLAISGLPTKSIIDALGPLGDMLVAVKGVTASEEEGAELAGAMVKAWRTGMGRGLQPFGIFLDKNFKKLKGTAEGWRELIKAVEKYKGANAAAMLTAIGRIQVAQKHIHDLSKEIGFELLPVQAELAEGWAKALPELKPVIIFSIRRIGDALGWAAKQAADLGKTLLPMQDEDAWKSLAAIRTGAPVAPLIARPPEETVGEYFGRRLREMNQNTILEWQNIFEPFFNRLTTGWLKAATELSENFGKPFLAGLAKANSELVSNLSAAWSAIKGVNWTSRAGGLNFLGSGMFPPGGGVPAAQKAAGGSAGVLQSDIDAAAAAMNQAPEFAFGGVVRRPTFAMLGERGPEAIVPLRGRGAGATTLNFSPNITINGNATESEQRSMDSRLRSLARDFVAQFQRAQSHERRLSYEGGYA
jgi:hypothetical protein